MMGRLSTVFRLCRAGRLVALVALLAPATRVSVTLAAVPDEARKGAELFADSSYKEAADAFRQATIAAPDDVRWRYDLGLSEALGQDFESALNHLDLATRQSPPEVASASHYNAGNVHLAMGNFAEAAGAYRQALIKNPRDLDAKHNLELALKKLQEQESQSGSQNDSTQNQDGQKEKQQDQKQKEKNQQDQKQDQDQPEQEQEKSQDQQASDSTGQEPPPNPESQPTNDSTLSRDQAERILRALADEEARLRNQAKKAIVAPAPGGKDW